MKLLKPTQQRSLNSVPRIFLILIVVSATLQITWHNYSNANQANRAFLSTAPDIKPIRIIAMGEPTVFATVLMLWLQSFDNQPGISLSLQSLDYTKVISWLELISELNPESHYALFSAAYFYSNISDEDKQRSIFNFIEQRFKKKPNQYWRWLAHASIKARHRLNDNDLALQYAETLRTYTTSPTVPAWAKQIEIGILEEKGEYESAKLLIGGLLSAGKITDPYELKLLNTRLKGLKNKGAMKN